MHASMPFARSPAHAAQAGDPVGPVAFDRGAPLEREAKLGEERNGSVEVFHHDADVVHSRDRHDVIRTKYNNGPGPTEPDAMTSDERGRLTTNH